MTFDAKYETGVLWQDFQHKQLIDLVEKVKSARSENKDKNLYRYTLAFLAMYVNHHFKLEDEYMEKYNYPDNEVHRKEHHEFIKELKIFRADNIEYSEAGTDELLIRLGEWIFSHILENDQKLGEYIISAEKKGSHNPGFSDAF